MESVLRAYVELWTEPDPTRRRGLIEASLRADAEIVGPGYRLAGHEAVAAEVERFLKAEPGFRLALTSGFDAHDRWVRFTFDLIDPKEGVVNHGWDLVELAADGKIVRVISFWGELPPPPVGWPARLLPSARGEPR